MRRKKKNNPKHIKEAKTKKCVQEKIVYIKYIRSNRNGSGSIFLVRACSRKMLLYWLTEAHWSSLVLFWVYGKQPRTEKGQIREYLVC